LNEEKERFLNFTLITHVLFMKLNWKHSLTANIYN